MARSFFITRNLAASFDDPTALEFWPAKGSDELHEALKEAFPFEANLSARMRAAVIEFLLQEQQAEQLTPMSTEYLPSPQSSFVSTLPSPAIATPQTPQDQSQPRRTSAGQRSLQEGMDVWQLPNKPHAKIHTRRTMTAEEKKAYKQKRIVGACNDCKRRRRKCDHNSPSAGTSVVPQKVGKSKKRASAAMPASKPESALDFSWSGSNFNFDSDLASMAMTIDSEMPSFELDDTEFGFSPDLNNDWQLFPDLSRPAHLIDIPSAWSSDFVSYEGSTFTPQAEVSQSRVSTRSSDGGVLDTGAFDSCLPVDSMNEPFVTDANVIRYKNSPISPVSLSPMSRTQSGSDLLDQCYYSTLQGGSSSSRGSAANAPIFSAGASIEQSRVRPDTSNWSLLTPSSLSFSPLSPSQSIGGLYGSPGDQNPTRIVPVPAPNIRTQNDENAAQPANALRSTASASSTQHLQTTTGPKSARKQGKPGVDCPYAHLIRETQMPTLDNTHVDPDLPRLKLESPEHRDKPALRAQANTQAQRFETSTLQRLTRFEDGTSTTSPTEQATRLQRTISALSLRSSRTGFVAEEMLSFAGIGADTSTSRVLNGRGSYPSLSSRQESSPTLASRTQRSVTDTPAFSTLLATSPNDWSLAQAPICVALQATCYTLAEASDSLSFISTLLVGIVMVLAVMGIVRTLAKSVASSKPMTFRSIEQIRSEGRLRSASDRSSKSMQFQAVLSARLRQIRAPVII